MVQINARKVRRIYHGETKVYEDYQGEWQSLKWSDGQTSKIAYLDGVICLFGEINLNGNNNTVNISAKLPQSVSTIQIMGQTQFYHGPSMVTSVSANSSQITISTRTTTSGSVESDKQQTGRFIFSYTK